MPAESPNLCGLQPITGRLLERLVARPGGKSRELPTVVAIGARGTGKTALLRAVKYRVERVPHIYLDFERGEMEPRKVLGELAFGLNRHWKQFGRIAFPQLWLCMLVVGTVGQVPPDNRRAAVRQLRAIMAQDQPIERNRKEINDLVQSVGSLAGGALPAWALPATDWLLRGVGWFGRYRLLRKVRRLAAPGGKAEDALVDIAHWAHADAAERAAVDAIFCEAFLGDLRRAYSGLQGSRRTLNCVALLDNVHTPAGRKFLQVLQEARRRAGDPDPMVVVATSRVWLPMWNDAWHRPGTHRLPEGGSPLPAPRKPSDIDADHPAGETPDNRWMPWYLIDLSQVTAQDVADFADLPGLPPAVRITDFLSALTGGHPGGVAWALEVITARDPEAQNGGLRGIFEFRLPTRGDEPARTLAETAQAELLQDFDAATELHELTTVSAARTIDMFYRPELLHADHPDGESLLQTLRDRLWIREIDSAETNFEIDPWLRRILLRRLASRMPPDTPSWVRAHTLCRDFYRSAGREADACYHALALHDLGTAVDFLARPFGTASPAFGVDAAAAWLADLDLVTSAPNRLPPDTPPIEQVQQLVRDSGPDLSSTLAWLVAALWISNDPLGDPKRTLHHTINSEFRHLAHGRGPGSDLLYERAERYA